MERQGSTTNRSRRFRPSSISDSMNSKTGPVAVRVPPTARTKPWPWPFRPEIWPLRRKSDRELLVPCVACYNRFKVAEKEVKDHPGNLSISYPIGEMFPSGMPSTSSVRNRSLTQLKRNGSNRSPGSRSSATMGASPFGLRS